MGAERIDAAFRPHQTVEGKIVEHHGFAIFCALNIALDRIVLGDRGGGGGGRIFDQSELFGMKATVRDRPRRQPVRRIYRPARQVPAISNRASISTALSNGNSATPTVDLAWRPLSPKTSTMKSEAPFITAAKLGEPRRRIDESAEPHAPRNPVEIAQGRLGLREDIYRAQARRRLSCIA